MSVKPSPTPLTFSVSQSWASSTGVAGAPMGVPVSATHTASAKKRRVYWRSSCAWASPSASESACSAPGGAPAPASRPPDASPSAEGGAPASRRAR